MLLWVAAAAAVVWGLCTKSGITGGCWWNILEHVPQPLDRGLGHGEGDAGRGHQDPAAATKRVHSSPEETVAGGEHEAGAAVNQSLASPESGSDELDGVGGEASDHVDAVVGHGLDARGAGGDDGGGGAHQVTGHVAHEAGARGDGGVREAGECGRGSICSRAVVKLRPL